MHRDEITQRQLAELLGVTQRSVRRWTRNGLLKPTRMKPGRITTYSLKRAMAAVERHGLPIDPSTYEALNAFNHGITT